MSELFRNGIKEYCCFYGELEVTASRRQFDNRSTFNSVLKQHPKRPMTGNVFNFKVHHLTHPIRLAAPDAATAILVAIDDMVFYSIKEYSSPVCSSSVVRVVKH